MPFVPNMLRTVLKGSWWCLHVP